jgi:hypothetical protein
VDGTTLEQAHAAMVHAQNEFSKLLEKTNEIKHLFTSEGFQDQISQFRDTSAAKAVDKAVESVRARRDEAQAKMDKILNPSSRGDTAHELRNGRIWDRAKAVLDAAKDGKYAAASTLIKNATREELAVLVEELPAYMTAHGQPTEWIPTQVGQALPEYPAARAQLDKATAALQIVEQNARFLRRGFEEGRAPYVLADPFKPRFPGDSTNKYDPDKG